MSSKYRVTVNFLLASLLGGPVLPSLMSRILTSERTADVIIDNKGNVIVRGSTEPVC